MLAVLRDFFKMTPKETTPKRTKKPLHVSRQIFYRTQSNLFQQRTPDVSTVFNNASQLPMMQHADLSFCVVGNGSAFVGFNKPKKVCGYGIFYPINTLNTNRSQLIRFAQEHGLNVYVLTMNGEQTCIKVTKPDGAPYYLVDPSHLRLRREVAVATQPNRSSMSVITAHTNTLRKHPETKTKVELLPRVARL